MGGYEGGIDAFTGRTTRTNIPSDRVYYEWLFTVFANVGEGGNIFDAADREYAWLAIYRDHAIQVMNEEGRVSNILTDKAKQFIKDYEEKGDGNNT